MKKSVVRLALLVCMIVILAACGSEPEATPTPTKTPEAGSGEPAVIAPTVTPVAPAAPASGGQPAPADSQTATQSAAAQTQSEATVNADGGLNLRSDPNASSTVIRVADKGEKFIVVSKTDDGQWVQVAQNGQTLGWLAAEFVDLTGTQVAQSETATSNVPAVPAPSASTSTGGPEFGAQAFLWWRPEIAARDLDLMRDGGFNWVKQSFAWETIEGAGQGHYDWSVADRVVAAVNASGLKLLARLSVDPDKSNFWAGTPPGNSAAFANFAAAVAQRYNCQPGAVGCIHAFQIWNEPNLAREWGGVRPNPAQYVDFLRTAYRAVKNVSPNALVISAGMAPTGSNDNNAMPDDIFYEEMYKAMAGNSNCCFDMLGVHGAGFAAPPELDPAEAAANKAQYGGYRFFAFRHVEDIRAIMVKYGDSNKKIVLLEFGWTFDSVNPAYKWHGADAGIDQLVQGQYLKRAYEYAAANWQPWIGLMSMLTMPNLDWVNDGNPQDEEQYWWAIMEPSQIDEKKFRAAYIILCDHFNRQRGQFCPYDPARQ